MPRRSVHINGPALRAIRERTGLSVRALVALLAQQESVTAHEDHIRNLETEARNASPELISAVAKVLQVPVVALMRDAAVPAGSR